jgi:hypothetical protein
MLTGVVKLIGACLQLVVTKRRRNGDGDVATGKDSVRNVESALENVPELIRQLAVR